MSSFFPTFFVLILSYLSGTCAFFFADTSGWNFLSSFGPILSGTFFPGVCVCGGRGGGALAPCHHKIVMALYNVIMTSYDAN